MTLLLLITLSTLQAHDEQAQKPKVENPSTRFTQEKKEVLKSEPYMIRRRRLSAFHLPKD